MSLYSHGLKLHQIALSLFSFVQLQTLCACAHVCGRVCVFVFEKSRQVEAQSVENEA